MKALAPRAALPLLEQFKADLYHCSDCNYCVDAVWEARGIEHVCPTLEHHSPALSYSGRGYMMAARAWLEGNPLSLETLAERVFSCTTCGNCEQVCPIGLRPTQIGQALRGELIAHDTIPAPVRSLRANLRADGNPHGLPRTARTQWAAGLASAATAEILYLPGCAAVTLRPSEARAAFRLLLATGRKVAHLDTEDSCCGAPYRELGEVAEARGAIQVLAAKATATGATRVVTSGLECARSWASAPDLPASARTFGEWLLQAITVRELVLTPKADPRPPVRVACLDTCQARNGDAHGSAGETLRRILGLLGIAPTHDALGARHVVCCGAAGGMPGMQRDAATRMARARLDEATVSVGLDPRCVAHSERARAQDDPAVFSIAEFIDRYFDAATDKRGART